MVGVSMAPIVGRVVDGLVPWFATVIATFGSLIFYSIQLGAGGINIAAVIIACFGLDVGRQMQQVSLTTAVYGISEAARSRMNAVLIICVCIYPLLMPPFFDDNRRKGEEMNYEADVFYSMFFFRFLSDK